MRRLLQSIIYNRKLYDRPQDTWVCGRAAEGCACIYGPGAKGECRATGQCLPARKNDRWVCTRAISLGAACEPGPRPDGTCGCPVPPCRPVRSLRSWRGRAVRAVLVVALGAAGLVFWGRTRANLANPGPLTNQHAVSAQQCGTCHTEAMRQPGQTRAARMAEHDQLCIRCHDLGPHATSPHGVAESELALLTRRPPAASGPRPAVLAAATALGAPGQLACAACHREHQGADFDLKRIADLQCQVCHKTQFRAFSEGHPEFSDYPYARRTRLQFDHVSHFQKHFTDTRWAAAAPSSCAQCHEPAPTGDKMLVRGFEAACAACHTAEIDGRDRAGDKGLVFFRLPAFDTNALEEAGHAVGEWPLVAEGGLTPFMRWLLEGDEAARAALAALGDQDPGDLRRATAEQKAAAAKVLWAVKGLFADLVTQGQPVIVRRLAASPAAQLALTAGTGQFSPDTALAAQQAWLPNLLAEVAAHRRGEKVARRAPVVVARTQAGRVASVTAADPDDLLIDLPTDKKTTATAATAPATPVTLKLDEADARVAAGGWYRQDDTLTLHYRPGAHADAFLGAWLGGTAGRPEPSAQKIFAQLSADNAPGACLKCHSVDRTPAGTVVNWLASRPRPEVRAFTRFKHAAHFSLMGDQGCMTCHTFAVGADYAGSFGANRDPALFRSNFAPMSKASCTNCHQPARSGESCQQCHNYHTGEMRILRAQAAALPPARK